MRNNIAFLVFLSLCVFSVAGRTHASVGNIIDVNVTAVPDYVKSLPGQYSTVVKLEDGSMETTVVLTLSGNSTFTNIFTFKVSTSDGTLVYECVMSGDWTYVINENSIWLDDIKSVRWKAKEAYDGFTRVSEEDLRNLEKTSYFKEDVERLENSFIHNFMEMPILSFKSGYMTTRLDSENTIKWRKRK